MTYHIDTRLEDALDGIATRRGHEVEAFVRDCLTCAKYHPEKPIPCQYFECVNGGESWYTRRKEK